MVNSCMVYGRIYDVFYAIKLISLGQKISNCWESKSFFEAFHMSCFHIRIFFNLKSHVN